MAGSKKPPFAVPPRLADVCDGEEIIMSDEDKEVYVRFLKQFIADLKVRDDIVLAEHGYPTGALWRDTSLQYDLDLAQWGLAKVLRYLVPCRLHEATEALEDIKGRIVARGDPLISDPLVIIWLGVAYSYKHRDQEAVDLLSLFNWDTQEVAGPKNALIGRSSFARSLRRLGRITDTEPHEHAVATYLRTHPYTHVPSVVFANVLAPDEVSNACLDLLPPGFYDEHIEMPYVQGQYKSMLVPNGGQKVLVMTDITPPGMQLPHSPKLDLPNPPHEVDKGKRMECWVSGCRVTDPLMKCARCKRASYCGPDHQRLAWKSHKTTCATRE